MKRFRGSSPLWSTFNSNVINRIEVGVYTVRLLTNTYDDYKLNAVTPMLLLAAEAVIAAAEPGT
jgi:hypothetical protein